MTNLKKKYSKPELGQFTIDKDICLMMTSEGSGPGDPFSAAPQTQQEQQPVNTFDNNFESNPFE
ncbi:hypothetical protein [Plebeiibacterium marinum]|uniref:Uncharacterized protein n=1 Tax=Plebeiibacterium marinum TaxID=2992111 RepID=A0AAE3SLF5_9BACT|nr:hypothetical protein [Plebeiobacterium marinum]MCW3807652.1 hypothetical protein [Plebeiobacterium marinum]